MTRPEMVRSAASVIAGYLAMMIAVIVAQTIAVRMGGVADVTGRPHLRYLAINLGYSALAAMLGGYVTALVARRSEVLHAAFLGVLGLSFGIASMISY